MQHNNVKIRKEQTINKHQTIRFTVKKKKKHELKSQTVDKQRYNKERKHV